MPENTEEVSHLCTFSLISHQLLDLVRCYLGLYAFKRNVFFALVIMNLMQCLTQVWHLQQADFMNT